MSIAAATFSGGAGFIPRSIIHPSTFACRLVTPDRLQARNRGAVLTASYDRVVTMLNERVRANRELTERELQAIAKAMYEERLAEVSTEQRATPYDAEQAHRSA